MKVPVLHDLILEVIIVFRECMLRIKRDFSTLVVCF